MFDVRPNPLFRVKEVVMLQLHRKSDKCSSRGFDARLFGVRIQVTGIRLNFWGKGVSDYVIAFNIRFVYNIHGSFNNPINVIFLT
jgi:hypothetical protein